MRNYLRRQVTPREFDHAIGAIAAAICILGGVDFLVHGYWRVGSLMLIAAVGPLIQAIRFWLKSRDSDSEGPDTF